MLRTENQPEAEGEDEDEEEVAGQDQGVGPHDRGEHVDVDGDRSVGNHPDQEEVELKEGEEEGEGGQVALQRAFARIARVATEVVQQGSQGEFVCT